jgi:hypothetical protein
MTKCPSCGNSGLFLKTFPCAWCNRMICQKCAQYTMVEAKLDVGKTNMPPSYMNLIACSLECSNDFAQRVVDYPAIADIGTDTTAFGKNARELWNRAVCKAFADAPERNQEVIKIVEIAVQLDSEQYNALLTRRLDKGAWVPGGLMDRFVERARLACAQNLERVGRPLDAAVEYEHLKMYDKARQLREKDKQVIVKQTTIALDLNALLNQVRNEGLVAVYKCPNCGGNLRINKESTASSLRICVHCGKEIHAMDLTDFLKTVLS